MVQIHILGDNQYDVLKSVNGTVEHNYDGLGNRRERIENGIRTRYIIDGLGMGNMIAETDQNGNPTAFYIYGGGLLYRKIPNGSGYDDGYYHSNFQGSTIVITDENEINTHEYAYDPYGNILQANEADTNPFTFIGKYGVMKESGQLYFMRARFYDALTGRFVSQDPIWSTNLFAYGGGNPVMRIDPSGNRYENLPMCMTYCIDYSTFIWDLDGDEKLSLKEANKWYRYPFNYDITVPIDKIDFDYITATDLIPPTGDKVAYISTRNKDGGLVYGQLMFYSKNRMSNDIEFEIISDEYDFRLDSWIKRPFRNLDTIIGEIIATNFYSAQGYPYRINFKGTVRLNEN